MLKTPWEFPPEALSEQNSCGLEKHPDRPSPIEQLGSRQRAEVRSTRSNLCQALKQDMKPHARSAVGSPNVVNTKRRMLTSGREALEDALAQIFSYASYALDSFYLIICLQKSSEMNISFPLMRLWCLVTPTPNNHANWLTARPTRRPHWQYRPPPQPRGVCWPSSSSYGPYGR